MFEQLLRPYRSAGAARSPHEQGAAGPAAT